MNKTANRSYRMTARAEQAAETGQRILDAAYAKFSTSEFDAVSLGQVAEAAGVTVQTVIRRFGGKDGLFLALCEREFPLVEAERVPHGGSAAGLASALKTLVAHYEKDGPVMLNFLRQEARVPELAKVIHRGRALHENWVRSYCTEVLGDPNDAGFNKRLLAAIAATDLSIWKLLRLDKGLGPQEVEDTMRLLLRGLSSE